MKVYICVTKRASIPLAPCTFVKQAKQENDGQSRKSGTRQNKVGQTGTKWEKAGPKWNKAGQSMIKQDISTKQEKAGKGQNITNHHKTEQTGNKVGQCGT
jgi:hypothetical protein